MNTDRRTFIRNSSATAGTAALATQLAFPTVTFGVDLAKKFKIGLIGCGGRGTGAAAQALSADSNTEMWALADLWPEQIEQTRQILDKQHSGRINVPEGRRFTGLNAYQELLDSGVDIVLIATPPGFRPQHFAAAVDAGKHVFAEKPVATDAPGVRSVLATNEKAKAKGLAVVSGLCWRYETNMRKTVKALQDGAIGKIVNCESTRYLKGVAKMAERQEGWTDLEYQLRNWYYFTWLSGDFIAEQFVHELDKMSWLLGRYPASVLASGGRISRTEEKYGHVFDHFNAMFEYDDGVRYYASTRQQPNCDGVFRDHVFGTEGWCDLMKFTIYGKNQQRIGKNRTNMHQLEHDEMYAALRQGEIPNNGEYMAHSTLMGLMARESAYTGKQITWDQMLKSKKRYVPEKLDWNMKLPDPPVAKPGITPFI
ncbi:MAG: Gfo/Idh/MocA family oxidoreductase [Verrucomicrobiae bacterium]|nr:Gfo/Idh/MocA family oxidoreductase [Verrucomicrobiae bacterium]